MRSAGISSASLLRQVWFMPSKSGHQLFDKGMRNMPALRSASICPHTQFPLPISAHDMRMKTLPNPRQRAEKTCGLTPFWDNLPQPNHSPNCCSLHLYFFTLCDDRMADMPPFALCAGIENRIIQLLRCCSLVAAILPDRRSKQAAVPLWKVSLAPPRRRTEPGPQGPGFLFVCLPMHRTFPGLHWHPPPVPA
jgi:hypothetical protein